MAMEVPYSGAPSVAPENNSTPYLNINVPAAAFGADTARAIQGVGGKLEHVGEELFNRAVAMQQLEEAANANAGVAATSTRYGDLMVGFRSKEGKNASDALPQFQKDLDTIREEERAKLKTPYAQKLFDNETRTLHSRTVVSAGAHAGEQLKKYSIETNQARIDANRNQVELNPNDDEAFKKTVLETDRLARNGALERGANSVTVENAARDARSSLWFGRIKTISVTEPFKADKLMKEALKRGDLNRDDADKIYKIIHDSQNRSGARNIAQDIHSGEDQILGEKEVPISTAKAAIGGYGQNAREYGAVGPTVTDNAGNKGQPLGRYGVMDYNLGSMLKRAGMDSMTKEEFLKDPKAQDKLFETLFAKDMKGKSFNDAAKLWMTPGSDTDKELKKANSIIAQLSSRETLAEAAQQRAEKLAPENPDLPFYAGQRANIIKREMDRNIQDQSVRDNKTLTEAFTKAIGDDGKLPTSIDQITTNPDTAAAWERLTATEKKQYQDVLAANARGGYGKTPENQDQFMTLLGEMSRDDLSSADRERLLNFKVGTWAGPNDQKLRLMAAQTKLLKQTAKAPDLNKAVSSVSELTKNVLDPKSKDYNKFIGALRLQLELATEEKKSPLTYEEQKQIATNVLKENLTSKGVLFDSKSRFYRMEPSYSEKKMLETEFKNVHGTTPTPEQLNRMYMDLTYQRLYGKRVGGKSMNQSLPVPSPSGGASLTMPSTTEPAQPEPPRQ
jgi:hypothetical protein